MRCTRTTCINLYRTKWKQTSLSNFHFFFSTPHHHATTTTTTHRQHFSYERVSSTSSPTPPLPPAPPQSTVSQPKTYVQKRRGQDDGRETIRRGRTQHSHVLIYIKKQDRARENGSHTHGAANDGRPVVFVERARQAHSYFFTILSIRVCQSVNPTHTASNDTPENYSRHWHASCDKSARVPA